MRITVDLLRKRAEHNEGCLSTLQEITLHQQEIEKIEVIGDVCRKLEILYLCNNYISKMEGLRHLKMLKYINLAINNIAVIEGLEGCECLNKLDLTLNFISDIDSVVNLRANTQLEILHLTGNGCTATKGYRSYVAHTLPQLITLDGEDILKSERISARQEEPAVLGYVVEAAVAEREKERLKEEMVAKGIDPFPAKFNEKGERVYGHSPEERLQMLREEEQQRKKHAEEQQKASTFSQQAEEMNKKPIRLTAEEEMAKYGRLLLRNEGKVNFRLDEDDAKVTVLTVEPGKYISTASIAIDLQPQYVRITIKDKLLQLVFSRDVCADKAKVERSMTTGQLKLTVPVSLATAGPSHRRRVSDGDQEGEEDKGEEAATSGGSQPIGAAQKSSINNPTPAKVPSAALSAKDTADLKLPTAAKAASSAFLKEVSSTRLGAPEPAAVAGANNLSSGASSASTSNGTQPKVKKNKFVEELDED